MVKTQKFKNSKKRKGGRQPVAFVTHPDTGVAVSGLRVHKASTRYYRIAEDKKTRHFYPKAGRVGLAYLRRAIYEHECYQNGLAPSDVLGVRVTKPIYDEFGSELPVVGTFDNKGNAVNVIQIGRDSLAEYFREQLSNPLTRKEFAELVGIPELDNIHSLPPVVAPLSLSEIIDSYLADKTFSTIQQPIDAKAVWKLFTGTLAVDNLEDIENAKLQSYKKVIEAKYALRTQKNHYGIVQGILNHAHAVFTVHRDKINTLKLEIKLNCQNWSQDKKIKARRKNAKPMSPETYRKMLAQAKKHSLLAHAIYLSAANFAYHGKEATDLRIVDIDWDKMLLSSYREKDGIQRVAVVWTETARAIKAYMASDEYLSHPEYVFSYTTREKKTEKMNIAHVVLLNRNLRDDASLPDSVKFDGIRSMTSTAMGATSMIAQKWVMGHAVSGELDTYTVRDATETRKALSKAHKVIFGK